MSARHGRMIEKQDERFVGWGPAGHEKVRMRKEGREGGAWIVWI